MTTHSPEYIGDLRKLVAERGYATQAEVDILEPNFQAERDSIAPDLEAKPDPETGGVKSRFQRNYPLYSVSPDGKIEFGRWMTGEPMDANGTPGTINALVVDRKRKLVGYIVQRRLDRRYAHPVMGFTKLGESLRETAIREAGEEAGTEQAIKEIIECGSWNPNPTFVRSRTALLIIDVDSTAVTGRTDLPEGITKAVFVTAGGMRQNILAGIDKDEVDFRNGPLLACLEVARVYMPELFA